MADKYAQGGVTAEGTPTPVPLRAGEYAIPHYLMLRAKGHGSVIDGITERRTSTFPPLIMYNDEDTED